MRGRGCYVGVADYDTLSSIIQLSQSINQSLTCDPLSVQFALHTFTHFDDIPILYK